MWGWLPSSRQPHVWAFVCVVICLALQFQSLIPIAKGHLGWRGRPGVEREARRGFTCRSEQGPVSIPRWLSGPLLLLDGERAGNLLLLVEHPSSALVSGMAGHGSTSLFPSCTPWCCLTFLPPLWALPRGWANHPPDHSTRRCSSCWPLIPVTGLGTPCSQRPAQLPVYTGALPGSPHSAWWRLSAEWRA